jgi:type IX secretion system substrate protein
MKKILFSFILFFFSQTSFGQAYIPMPSDSGATWRYRLYEFDFETIVNDNILFLNGHDTTVHGNTYHQVWSRSRIQSGAPGFDPPVVPAIATTPDIYYGAIRETGKMVYHLTIAGETLIYDFNAAVGDSIPAYSGKNKVTATDIVLINGVTHKRYLTNDTSYFVIEGVGSNRGLLPGLNDGSNSVRFYCFYETPVVYSPNPAFPCTDIYPVGYDAAVPNTSFTSPLLEVYPVPAKQMVHIAAAGLGKIQAIVFNDIGQAVGSYEFENKYDLPVNTWPKGLYFVRLSGGVVGVITKKFIVE